MGDADGSSQREEGKANGVVGEAEPELPMTNGSAKRADILASCPVEYGDRFESHLLEQYKLIRSAITDLQHDRNANNRFLITLGTALVAAEGYLLQMHFSEISSWTASLGEWAIFLVPFLGILLSTLWVRWNRSYRTAIAVRYDLLREMELFLPASPFARELVLREERGYLAISAVLERLAMLFLVAFVAMAIPWIVAVYRG